MNAVIDRFLSIAISKKLTVFALGTILLFNDKISGVEWLHLSMLYIGVQGSIDVVKEYLKK